MTILEDTQPAPDSTGGAAYRIGLALDAVAVLAVAVGVAWGLWRWLGPFAVAAGGIVLGVLVYLSEVARDPRPRRAPVTPRVADRSWPSTPPGPTHPGSLHVSGG